MAAGLAFWAWLPLTASAQAFTLPRGIGGLSLTGQWVDNTGHRLSDGYYAARGESVTSSLALDVEYGVTDRLGLTAGLPYVFAKYTGDLPPRSGQARDECQCWQSGFQDFSFGARYRFGDGRWAVTPLFRWGQPSHAYPYQGEAVVGNYLAEAQLGVSTGLRLTGILSKANVQATYTYAFVERALDEISVNRSNAAVHLGYSVNRRLYLHTSWLGLKTHGGLRAGSDTGNPFPVPGEINTPERRAEANRLQRVQWMQLAGGAAFDAGPVDIFASFTKYVWGRDAHNGKVFSVGTTWYFGSPK